MTKIIKQIVYIASSKSQQIHVLQLNDNGLLNLIQIINVPGQIRPMAISRDKRFLYIGVRPKHSIIVYHIALNDGSLSLVKNFTIPGSPTYISTDHKDCFLFSCSYNSGCISVISLNDGLPVEITDIVEGIEGCHSANLLSNNQTLWVTALKQDRIYLFKLENNGKLIKNDSVELQTIKGSGPRHIAFHPNNKYAYVINELNSSINVWQINNLTNIKCIQTLNMVPNNFVGTRWGADIHITSNGKYLYTCDRTFSILTIFGISKNGSELTIKGFQRTEIQPRGFNIDECNKFLISAGQKSNHISLYEITEPQGFLKKKGRYAVGQEPTWVIISAYKNNK